MKISIEFTGITRAIAQASEIDLEMPQGSTYRDLVKILAKKYPGMIGLIIDPDQEKFLSSNMFVVDGNLEFPAMIMDEKPVNGQHISLMSVITGG